MRLLNLMPRCLFFLLFVTLVACNNDDEDTIGTQAELVGTWQLTEIHTEFPEGTDVRAFYQQYFEDLGVPESSIAAAVDTIIASLDEPITSDDIGTVTWALQADGTFIESDGTVENVGTWTLSNDNVLTITNGSDDMVVTIASLTDSSLKVQQDINRFLDDGSFGSLGPDFPEGTLVRIDLVKQF